MNERFKENGQENRRDGQEDERVPQPYIKYITEYLTH